MRNEETTIDYLVGLIKDDTEAIIIEHEPNNGIPAYHQIKSIQIVVIP